MGTVSGVLQQSQELQPLLPPGPSCCLQAELWFSLDRRKPVCSGLQLSVPPIWGLWGLCPSGHGRPRSLEQGLLGEGSLRVRSHRGMLGAQGSSPPLRMSLSSREACPALIDLSHYLPPLFSPIIWRQLREGPHM